MITADIFETEQKSFFKVNELLQKALIFFDFARSIEKRIKGRNWNKCDYEGVLAALPAREGSAAGGGDGGGGRLSSSSLAGRSAFILHEAFLYELFHNCNNIDIYC